MLDFWGVVFVFLICVFLESFGAPKTIMSTPVKTLYLIYYNISTIFFFVRNINLVDAPCVGLSCYSLGCKFEVWMYSPLLHWASIPVSQQTFKPPKWCLSALFPKLGVFDIHVKIPLRKMRGLVIAGWPGRIRCSSILQAYQYTDWSVMIWQFFLDPKLGTLYRFTTNSGPDLGWFFSKVGAFFIDSPQILRSTLPKTNIAPENRPSQKETSIPTIHFQVRKC